MTGIGTHSIKTRKIRHNSIGEQFGWRPTRMLISPAHRELSLSGHRLLDRVEVELGQHGGADNGKLPVTFDDFERYGVHRHAIAPAMREVVALGFLEITEQGRAGNADFRKPNKFRLTFRPTDYARPTNEWAKIETDEQAQTIAIAARSAKPEKAGSQWRKKPSLDVGNRHRKPDFDGTDSTTTEHGTDSTTTFYISGDRALAA
jgi:hypothetical protein